jgi:hypothetical protein
MQGAGYVLSHDLVAIAAHKAAQLPEVSVPGAYNTWARTGFPLQTHAQLSPSYPTI